MAGHGGLRSPWYPTRKVQFEEPARKRSGTATETLQDRSSPSPPQPPPPVVMVGGYEAYYEARSATPQASPLFPHGRESEKGGKKSCAAKLTRPEILPGTCPSGATRSPRLFYRTASRKAPLSYSLSCGFSGFRGIDGLPLPRPIHPGGYEVHYFAQSRPGYRMRVNDDNDDNGGGGEPSWPGYEAPEPMRTQRQQPLPQPTRRRRRAVVYVEVGEKEAGCCW